MDFPLVDNAEMVAECRQVYSRRKKSQLLPRRNSRLPKSPRLRKSMKSSVSLRLCG